MAIAGVAVWLAGCGAPACGPGGSPERIASAPSATAVAPAPAPAAPAPARQADAADAAAAADLPEGAHACPLVGLRRGWVSVQEGKLTLHDGEAVLGEVEIDLGFDGPGLEVHCSGAGSISLFRESSRGTSYIEGEVRWEAGRLRALPAGSGELHWEE